VEGWPDEIHAEAYGRIVGQLPTVVRLLRQERVSIAATDAERLLVATWLMGYAGCLNDLHAIGGRLPEGEDLGLLLEWLTLRRKGEA
jgi:hypothetical protein